MGKLLEQKMIFFFSYYGENSILGKLLEMLLVLGCKSENVDISFTTPVTSNRNKTRYKFKLLQMKKI